MSNPNPSLPPFPVPPQNQPQPPQWNFPFNQPAQQPVAQSNEPTLEQKVDSLLAQHNDMRNQVSELTAAVNGLGQNTQALHEWVVNQIEQVTSMVAGITQAIRTEGVQGILKNLFTGPGGPPSNG